MDHYLGKPILDHLATLVVVAISVQHKYIYFETSERAIVHNSVSDGCEVEPGDAGSVVAQPPCSGRQFDPRLGSSYTPSCSALSRSGNCFSCPTLVAPLCSHHSFFQVDSAIQCSRRLLI